VEVGAEQRLLFLNCEKFQTGRNLETMRRYERTDLHHPLASNVLTIRQQQLNTGSSSFSNKVSIFHALWQCCGMDLEPNWIRIQLCPWIRIQEGKMAHFIV
jgi:hypothetical protein